MLKNQSRMPQSAGGAEARGDAAAGREAPRDVVRQPPLRHMQLGPKAVGSFVPRLTRPAFERYGFSAATLITDWATIVGSALAGYTSPERLKWPRLPPGGGEEQGRPAATLVLQVDPGRALDVQYRSRQIVDRINAYFGYRAIGELRIVQAPIKPTQSAAMPAEPSTQRRPMPPPPEVETIADDGLRGALARMAAGLAQRAG